MRARVTVGEERAVFVAVEGGVEPHGARAGHEPRGEDREHRARVRRLERVVPVGEAVAHERHDHQGRAALGPRELPAHGGCGAGARRWPGRLRARSSWGRVLPPSRIAQVPLAPPTVIWMSRKPSARRSPSTVCSAPRPARSRCRRPWRPARGLSPPARAPPTPATRGGAPGDPCAASGRGSLRVEARGEDLRRRQGDAHLAGRPVDLHVVVPEVREVHARDDVAGGDEQQRVLCLDRAEEAFLVRASTMRSVCISAVSRRRSSRTARTTLGDGRTTVARCVSGGAASGARASRPRRRRRFRRPRRGRARPLTIVRGLRKRTGLRARGRYAPSHPSAAFPCCFSSPLSGSARNPANADPTYGRAATALAVYTMSERRSGWR